VYCVLCPPKEKRNQNVSNQCVHNVNTGQGVHNCTTVKIQTTNQKHFRNKKCKKQEKEQFSKNTPFFSCLSLRKPLLCLYKRVRKYCTFFKFKKKKRRSPKLDILLEISAFNAPPQHRNVMFFFLKAQVYYYWQILVVVFCGTFLDTRQ